MPKAKNVEFEKFDATVRKVLLVSREELKRREEEWKRRHAGRKAGRKRKPAPAPVTPSSFKQLATEVVKQQAEAVNRKFNRDPQAEAQF
jgi:hypothetical protein